MIDIDPRALRANTPNFGSKLTFSERCSILALHRHGVSPKIIAAAFGVNRRTVAKVIDDESTRYVDVRREERALGEIEFRRQYMTEEIVARINDAAVLAEAAEPQQIYDQKPRAQRAGVPSPRARLNAGITPVKLPHHEIAHRIEVQWHEANTLNDVEHPAGWFWRDLDSDLPEFWQADFDTDSHVTSAKALEHAKRTA